MFCRAQKVIFLKCVKYTCCMETVQKNGSFYIFLSQFLSILIYSLWLKRFVMIKYKLNITVYNFKN